MPTFTCQNWSLQSRHSVLWGFGLQYEAEIIGSPAHRHAGDGCGTTLKHRSAMAPIQSLPVMNQPKQVLAMKLISTNAGGFQTSDSDPLRVELYLGCYLEAKKLGRVASVSIS